MANIIIERTVSLGKVVQPEVTNGVLFVTENQAHTFRITALQAGSKVTLSGTVSAAFIKPNLNTVVFYGSLSNGVAVVTLPEACYTDDGRFTLTVFITTSGVKTALYSLSGNVKQTSTSRIVDPDDVLTIISDVQVNGTSVVADGVANVPLASASAAGAVKVGAGLAISSGALVTDAADQAAAKAGTNTSDPIVPSNQHFATFYGLAKAAGDTTQAASSNAVGTYTADALVKVQKMIGIYRAPWELIREDTFTNASSEDHIITVDGNGDSFELTDVKMLFEFPKVDATASSGNYGNIYFYYTDSSSLVAQIGTGINRTTTTAEAKGAWIFIDYQDGMAMTYVGAPATNSNNGTLNNRFYTYTTSDADRKMGIMLINDFSIIKINIKSITGTAHYKLYGRRKWTL